MTNSNKNENRTGAESNTNNIRSMLQATKEFPPDIKGDFNQLEQHRSQFIKKNEDVGSIPSASIKSSEKTVLNKLFGNKPELFIDKIGERLAFERTGVRLYEAAIVKALALNEEKIVDELRHICEEEAQHMELLMKVARELGADPTAVTPSADVTSVIGMGLIKVVSDPRTTMAQSLDALLSAELTDNAGWELLIELAADNGTEDVIASFTKALEQEKNHLERVKFLLKQSLM